MNNLHFEKRIIDVRYNETPHQGSFYGVEALALTDVAVHGYFTPRETWLSDKVYSITWIKEGKQVMIFHGPQSKRLAIRFALLIQEVLNADPDVAKYSLFNAIRRADVLLEQRYGIPRYRA